MRRAGEIGALRAARPRRLRALAVLLPLLVLAGCGGNGDDPTALPAETATAPVAEDAPSAPTSAAPGSPPALTGAFITDDICQARLPAGWIVEGPGSGSTPAGHRVAVFGNRLLDDARWAATVETFVRQAEAAGASIEEGDGWVRATYPDGRGLAYRARFPDRWCDVRLTARRGAIPEGELAAWNGIEASLHAAS